MRTPWIALLALGCSEYDVAEKVHFEVHHQPVNASVADVLFVVDDSASMAEEQALLGDNFSAFVDVVADTPADFQIGVVTTDPASAGTLRGPILTPDSADLQEAFLEAVAVGTDGSRDEQGLAAAVAALEVPGLLRDEARFHVVVLSDEDDHSPGDPLEYVVQLEGRAPDFVLHAVVGDLPNGCANRGSAASAAARYVDAATATEGWIDSICSEDYTAILTKLGLDVAGLGDTFPLKRVPDPSTLVVQVDGVEMPYRDIDGFTYDVGLNAIVFHGRAVPRIGMVVKVEYELLLGADESIGGGR